VCVCVCVCVFVFVCVYVGEKEGPEANLTAPVPSH
jgi:hypothetical protein